MQRQEKTGRRRIWSDADKEALIRKVASYSGPVQKLLDTMRISCGWFYSMRKAFLQAHPEIDLTIPVVKLASGWPADPEERRREARRRIAMRVPGKPSERKPVALDPAVASALAVYRDLPKLEKAPWRKTHRLSGAQLTKISRGLAGHGSKIIARLLSVNGNRQLTRLPDPIPVISMIPNSAPQPASVPCTLDDAILAFEVKRDHLMEFIDQLKRMRSGRS